MLSASLALGLYDTGTGLYGLNKITDKSCLPSADLDLNTPEVFPTMQILHWDSMKGSVFWE